MLHGMKRLAILVLVLSPPLQLSAQRAEGTLERIRLAPERPDPAIGGSDGGDALRAAEREMFGVSTFERLAGAPKLGPLEFVAPQFRGEFIRLALPIGEYLSDGIRAFATTKRRRQEQAARRRVEADLKTWTERASKP
jgi:hypothetical protein